MTPTTHIAIKFQVSVSHITPRSLWLNYQDYLVVLAQDEYCSCTTVCHGLCYLGRSSFINALTMHDIWITLLTPTVYSRVHHCYWIQHTRGTVCQCDLDRFCGSRKCTYWVVTHLVRRPEICYLQWKVCNSLSRTCHV